MKETLTINISGFVFKIDEDAYQILKKHLDKITAYFKIKEGGRKIISDIESHIAKLFFEQTGSKQEVINVNMVELIIETMGMPEDFANNNDTTSENKPPFSPPINTIHHRIKKLYRDTESKIIGGVCSGLGHYLNINKLVIRIIFFILFFINYKIGFFIYIILWIVIPRARTTDQRLDMKGEASNTENRGRSAEEGFIEIKNDASSSGSQRTSNVFTKIAGALFIIIGFISSTLLFLTFLAASKIIEIIPELHSGLFINHIFSDSMATTMTIAILIIVGVPLLLLLYTGTKMLFNFRSNNRSILLTALGAWTIAIIVVFSSGTGAIDIFSNDTSTTKVQNLAPCDTLFISLNEAQNRIFTNSQYEINNVKVMMVNGEERIVAHPTFTIDASENTDFKLEIKKYSTGNNHRNAQKNANSINYAFANEDTQLQLDPYFLLEEKGKWRNQGVSITLQLPVGQVVYLDDSLLPIIHDIENTSNTWDGDMTNTFWVMKPEGLTQSK